MLISSRLMLSHTLLWCHRNNFVQFFPIWSHFRHNVVKPQSGVNGLPLLLFHLVTDGRDFWECILGLHWLASGMTGHIPNGQSSLAYKAMDNPCQKELDAHCTDICRIIVCWVLAHLPFFVGTNFSIPLYLFSVSSPDGFETFLLLFRIAHQSQIKPELVIIPVLNHDQVMLLTAKVVCCHIIQAS